MKKEEIEEYIDYKIKTRFIGSLWELIFWFLVLIFLAYSVYEIVDVYRYNSDVEYRNKQLEFCSNIYNSDHVILEQCKEYFIILNND